MDRSLRNTVSLANVPFVSAAWRDRTTYSLNKLRGIPMSTTTTQEERLARRVDDLTANDPQFAAARPDPAVAAALEQPGLRLPQIIKTTVDAYAERPALGQRVVEFIKDS